MTPKQSDSARPVLERRALLGAAAASLMLPTFAFAQFRVDVTGVGLTQIPIAIAPMQGEPANGTSVSSVVMADLIRSGQFRSVNATGGALNENSQIAFPDWRNRGADALTAGTVVRLPDGRFDVRFRLWDVVGGHELASQSYVVAAGDIRLAAHYMADLIYEKLTGQRGIFATRIAYVTKQGRRYILWVADSDGERARPALSSVEPIISPAWSPNGHELAYVSFELRKPVVYVHNVSTGQRRVVANFKGSNSAPAWSPDGQNLAVTLTLSGLSQIYLVSRNGGAPRRLTQSAGIDTEPVFSPDGHFIYFVSDRGGSPQIYRMPASGGGAQRVTFSGGYNVDPAISPDGKLLAYVSGQNGRVQLMDLQSGSVTSVSAGGGDASPSFAPNSRVIVYATRSGGGGTLMTTTIDGQVKTRLAGAGADVREPSWGPYQN